MFCRHCSKDVHLLSHMTESEARELMRDKAGEDICVSYAIRKDGAIRFTPRPESLVPASALLRRTPREGPGRLARIATLGASALLAACTAHGEPEVVGEIVVDDTIPTQSMTLIPDEPCDPEEDLLVDGGIRAEPIEPPPVMKRGGLRAHPLPPPEPVEVVAGGLKAEPLPEPEPPVPGTRPRRL